MCSNPAGLPTLVQCYPPCYTIGECTVVQWCTECLHGLPNKQDNTSSYSAFSNENGAI